MEKQWKFIKKNKWWILTTAALAFIAYREHSGRLKAEKQLYLKEGKDQNQSDMIRGLVKEVKNMSYHLGKNSKKDE